MKNEGAHTTPAALSAWCYCFEAVSIFQYLGPTLSEDLDEKEESRRKTAAGNKAYFALVKILRSSRIVSESTRSGCIKP